jgi:predicted peroxiredoxin
MNKLLKRLRMTKTHRKAFADNGALITRNKKLAQAMKDAQKAINVAIEWAKEMGVEFSVEKTVVMLLTNTRSELLPDAKRPSNIWPRNTILQDSKIPGCYPR